VARFKGIRRFACRLKEAVSLTAQEQLSLLFTAVALMRARRRRRFQSATPAWLPA